MELMLPAGVVTFFWVGVRAGVEKTSFLAVVEDWDPIGDLDPSLLTSCGTLVKSSLRREILKVRFFATVDGGVKSGPLKAVPVKTGLAILDPDGLTVDCAHLRGVDGTRVAAPLRRVAARVLGYGS